MSSRFLTETFASQYQVTRETLYSNLFRSVGYTASHWLNYMVGSVVFLSRIGIAMRYDDPVAHHEEEMRPQAKAHISK